MDGESKEEVREERQRGLGWELVRSRVGERADV